MKAGALETDATIKYLGSHAPEKVLDIMSNSRLYHRPFSLVRRPASHDRRSNWRRNPRPCRRNRWPHQIGPRRAGGLRFVAGDVHFLTVAAAQLSGDDNLIAQMHSEARQELLNRCTASTNYDMLIEIYESTIKQARK